VRIHQISLLKNKAKHMNAIHRILRNGVPIERVDIVRATLNEAQEINHNLLDDIGYKNIIVDLSSCDYIDSTFFGAIVSAYRKIKAKGGSIVLVIGDTFLSKSFIFKDIASVFKVYRSIKEAMQLKQPAQNVIDANYDYASRRAEPVKIVQAQLMFNQE
jgi:anti-anti-sigma factor